MQWTTLEGWMTVPFLSYHAAMAGLANMAAAISPTETSLLISRLHMRTVIERLANLSFAAAFFWRRDCERRFYSIDDIIEC